MYKPLEFTKKGRRVWLVFLTTATLVWLGSTLIAFIFREGRFLILLFLPWHSLFIRTFLLLVCLVTGSLVARAASKLEAIEHKIVTLHEWARKLNQASQVDEILEYTMDAMETTLGFENAFIALKHDTMLKIEKCVGIQIPEQFRAVPLDETVLGAKVVEAFREGKSVLLKDMSKHPEYFSVSPQIKSKLAVAIKTEQEVMGVLEVGGEEIGAFDEGDQRLLEILASHVAVAIKKLREKEQRISLERLDALRNRFIAMVTHEIGSPLTPIKTELEMLQQGYHGALRKEQQEEIGGILEKVGRLTRLVEDFRQTSKLRSERITLEKREHRLIDTVEKALEGYRDVIGEEGIMVMKNIQQPLTMVYDEGRMVQVMRNLLKNAIDYTKDTVWIRCGKREDEVWVSVEDNGPGIPKEEQEKIFDPFYQIQEGEQEKCRRLGGTGLGLHICKQIIDAHKGEITVDSTPGEGTTFTIRFPKGT
ncbi:MAG: GAF domain-containing protein [Candidatus Korarchaeota archaeon]|nr:GAF domain-containing protein [Candidatus Korarchaeota archaeon]NIU85152.1 GAF domain-containing protein [Candidatus Thorarchaeota archaeon]NIW15204.1 GAF domain-containing protein [Candidatus Thorarchaeota archaeon]NIW53185.1 GAF domain-containing protein [Candidatus Korarchaeota archaeon]